MKISQFHVFKINLRNVSIKAIYNIGLQSSGSFLNYLHISTASGKSVLSSTFSFEVIYVILRLAHYLKYNGLSGKVAITVLMSSEPYSRRCFAVCSSWWNQWSFLHWYFLNTACFKSLWHIFLAPKNMKKLSKILKLFRAIIDVRKFSFISL